MRLVTYENNGVETLGVDLDGRVVAARDLNGPGTMLELIEAGPGAWHDLHDRVRGLSGKAAGSAIDELRLLAPIPSPPRDIFCAGKNYAAHAKEFGASGYDKGLVEDLPDKPVIFFKLPTTVVGPRDDIEAHASVTQELDYEAELAVIIGRGGRQIAKESAYDHVFGYTIVNDVTARDWQRGHDQWVLGKSFDTFCPMGPAVVTQDEIPRVGDLVLECHVNGELRQRAAIEDLIFDIPYLINYISSGITLHPGDIIATGTPKGVGIGFSPPRFLRPGDEVVVTIPPIGKLVNRVSEKNAALVGAIT